MPQTARQQRPPLIDIHQHIVYGVDDGAGSFEVSQQMLQRAQSEGVARVFATSHATPGRLEFPEERYYRHLDGINHWARENGIPVKVYSGCEILYTPETPDMLNAGRIPTLADTDYILVEFSPDDSYDVLREAARRLLNAGYLPIFAHIERYECLRWPKRVEELHDEYEVMMQVNANTLIRKQRFITTHWLTNVFRRGLVDFVASDAHNVGGRISNLSQAYDAVSEVYGRHTANQLCYENAVELLESAR